MNKQNFELYLLFICYNNASKKIARWYKNKKNKDYYNIKLTNKQLYKLINEISYC
jgi:hypothetical protein